MVVALMEALLELWVLSLRDVQSLYPPVVHPRVTDCQVGVFAAYVSRHGPA